MTLDIGVIRTFFPDVFVNMADATPIKHDLVEVVGDWEPLHTIVQSFLSASSNLERSFPVGIPWLEYQNGSTKLKDDSRNLYYIEQASGSWYEYKQNRRKYHTLRMNIVHYIASEHIRMQTFVGEQVRPPYEYKTDSEVRASLRHLVPLIEEYKTFMSTMIARGAVGNVPDITLDTTLDHMRHMRREICDINRAVDAAKQERVNLGPRVDALSTKVDMCFDQLSNVDTQYDETKKALDLARHTVTEVKKTVHDTLMSLRLTISLALANVAELKETKPQPTNQFSRVLLAACGACTLCLLLYVAFNVISTTSPAPLVVTPPLCIDF